MSETSSLTLSNMGRYGAPKGRQNKAKEGLCKANAKQGKGVFLGRRP